MAIPKTPLMKQYDEMKAKHPDAVLLFRVGDFYETFGEDAQTSSDILGITLTRRANGKDNYIAIAGFPHHALDAYLPKLVRAGKRVAICEQLDDPQLKKTKKRKVVEAISPMTQPQLNVHIYAYCSFLAILTEFKSLLNKLYLFEKIRRKSKEIQYLCYELNISARKAFEESIIINQPSLFD